MTGSGRDVLVTGGTGGLGQAVVAAFLEAGDRVLVPWIDGGEKEALEAAQAEAVASGRLRLVEADVSDEAGAAHAAEEAGPVSVLVNGVGGFGGGKPVAESGLALLDRMLRMNLRTLVATTRAVLPGMLSRGSGCIVNVASQAAVARPAGLAAYAASKAAVLVYTETLQKEVAERGIRVNAVSPSTIDTPANRSAMPDADFSTWTPPERIAAVMLWLASDEAAAVRGGALPV